MDMTTTMIYLKRLSVAFVAAVLVACGGGGDGAGTSSGSGTTGTPPATTPSTVADFSVEFDKNAILNSGADKVVLTVTTVDGSRNVVANVPVTVSVDSGAVFVPASTSTDTAGKFTGTITIGADRSTRTIIATVTVNNVTKNVPLTVTASVSAISDFIFQLDKTSITNSGSDTAVLTVLAVDSTRNVVANAPVAVSLNQNAVFVPGGASTDANGRFTGTILIGGDKADRTVDATITVNNITKVASVIVKGSQLAITPVPATPSPGQLVVLNISAADVAGSPIQSATLALTGTAGASGTFQTDAAGAKQISFLAPAAAGTYDVVVSGLGVSATKSIQVIDVGGAGVPTAVGPVASASLSPSPTSISANAGGSRTNRAKLSAKFLTTGNTSIPNMRVRFEILQPALGSGEEISTGNSTVYTDASGIAEADYIAGSRSSPTNGVAFRACYKLTEFTSPTDCPSSVAGTLTVAGSPLSISITDDNTIAKGLGGIAYIKMFLIQVNDSAGVAVKDAVVTASVDITHYGKGIFGSSYPKGVTPPTINDSQGIPAPTSQGFVAPTLSSNVWCANEDKNRNGFLEVGEDTNTDNVIQPRKAEIIVSYVTGNKTDANGQMLVQVTYGQNMGRWLAYTVRATTGVEGSEGDASKSYITDVLESDVANGSFNTPPFGSNACDARN